MNHGRNMSLTLAAIMAPALGVSERDFATASKAMYPPPMSAGPLWLAFQPEPSGFRGVERRNQRQRRKRARIYRSHNRKAQRGRCR